MCVCVVCVLGLSTNTLIVEKENEKNPTTAASCLTPHECSRGPGLHHRMHRTTAASQTASLSLIEDEM